jgi:hypothetical protein
METWSKEKRRRNAEKKDTVDAGTKEWTKRG